MATPDGHSILAPGAPYTLAETPWLQRGPRLGLASTPTRYSPARIRAWLRVRLRGLRVLDFTWVGAGSFTTRLLAEHGADVVKIESSTHSTACASVRRSPDGVPGVNRSGYFAERNANKRSVTIDLKHPEGTALVRRLVEGADIVANNFSPGVMDGFGLGYHDVSAINPSVIYLSMSMQGTTGPERNYLGYGITIAAVAGLTALSRRARPLSRRHRHPLSRPCAQSRPCGAGGAGRAPAPPPHRPWPARRDRADRADHRPARSGVDGLDRQPRQRAADGQPRCPLVSARGVPRRWRRSMGGDRRTNRRRMAGAGGRIGITAAEAWATRGRPDCGRR